MFKVVDGKLEEVKSVLGSHSFNRKGISTMFKDRVLRIPDETDKSLVAQSGRALNPNGYVWVNLRFKIWWGKLILKHFFSVGSYAIRIRYVGPKFVFYVILEMIIRSKNQKKNLTLLLYSQIKWKTNEIDQKRDKKSHWSNLKLSQRYSIDRFFSISIWTVSVCGWRFVTTKISRTSSGQTLSTWPEGWSRRRRTSGCGKPPWPPPSSSK